MLNVSMGIRETIYPLWIKYAEKNPVNATKIKYRIVTGKKLNLKNPQTFNEKVQWLKLFCYKDNPLVSKCSDKYAVREYVKECGCEVLLNEIYGCWDRAEDIDWNRLPQKFVLKCNHSSGQNIICTNKSQFNKNDAIKILNKWMSESYGKVNVELLYDNIPRKIIAEKYIETSDGKPPKDYKIFCSYGVPKLLFVASERNGEDAKFDYYTPEWEWIPVRNNHPNAGKIDPPKKLDDMLRYSHALSREFPMVRVDLYYENEQILFSELTFLHFGGSAPFEPDKYDKIFGELFPIKERVPWRS